MTPYSGATSSGCRVVVGVDAVVSLRSEDPTVPVVALVDELSPTEAVLAQTAGADVVLHTRPGFDHDQQPGLELAVRAASTMARRRRELAATSRQTGHDIAEALNVIGLIAQAGQQSRLDQTAAFTQIHDLVRKAGDDAWRAGRANRSSSFVVSAVDLGQLLQSGRLPPGVEICAPEPETYVFVDEPWLLDALGEVVGNARRAGATSVEIDASTRANRQTVTIVVSDDGHGFPAERSAIGQPFVTDAGSERLGVGLASIAEQAAELSGNLTLLDPGGDRTLTRVALSLPRIDAETLDPTVGEAGVEEAGTAPISSVDPATAQANILEGVVRHAPLDESLEGIVTAIENQLPGTICSVLSLHDGCRLKHSAGARLPLAYREAIDGVVIGVGQGSCGTAAHTGRPVVASDVTTDRNWVDFRSIAIEHGLRSCWSTPIVAAEGGETLGTFAVYTPTVWSPDREAIRLVNRFTYLAAVAIEHHRLFGALAESEARFRSAFEGAAAGIALASLGGAVLKANPALVELVGRPAAVLAGTSLLDLVDPEYRGLVTDSWACLTDDDRGADRVDNVEVPLAPSLEGPQRWLSLHTSLIPGESGRHPYLYVEARDVTAARQQLADMRAREAAEAANRAKTDFLALASHELRTPLNAILGFAQIMQLLELDERQRSDSVDQIVNAGRHLRDLIDELLDLSRIESGQLAVETGRVDACEVIDEAIELVGPLAAARDIVVVSHIEVGQAPWVLADHRCMRQVLINLLDNAVKYTSSGGRVDVAADDVDGSSVVRIRVTDSGPGISPDSLEAIFQPFHRLDRAADDESEGTGLGLALCARLMGEMGGSIGVTSTVGVGSSFWIEFPTATGAETHPATASSAGNRADAATAASSIEHAEGSVLYIEDDPACLDVMDEALRLRPKVTLHSARSAADGAAEIAGHHLDLVLLDVGLPDRSGWDLLAELRVTHPTLPVIVLTAGPDSVPTDVEPPDQMFTKPIDVGEVLRAIDRACSGPTGSDLFAEVVDSGHQ